MRLSESMRGLFQDNLGLKAMSLMLAFCVWLYVNSRGQVTVNFAVPVTPVGLGPELVLTDQDQATADVRIKGRVSALAGVSSHHLRLIADLTDQGPGDHWVSLGPDSVTGPERLEVMRVVPRQVRITLERRLERELKVVAALSGNPPPGFKITAISVSPNTVRLTGGESAFRGLNSLSTQPVSIDELNHSLRREVRLDLRGRDVQVLESAPVYVTITVEKIAPSPP
jgi:YbbR domain-containing protein